MAQRSILTLATNKKVYVDMAINLARSFIIWHKASEIEFYIATDLPQYIPSDVLKVVKVISLSPGQYGTGFSPKLHLDQITKTKYTLFVDSDCLIFGNLNNVFDRFSGRSVSVIGGYISSGEWFGDVGNICKHFKLEKLSKFNGGIYYLEKCETTTQVYEYARRIENQYDELGLIRLRNKPNDELLMSIAMSMYKQEPIPEDGSILGDPQACPGEMKLNVFNGKTELINPSPPNPKHQNWYPFEKVHPVVVHFLGYYTSLYLYKREALKMKFALLLHLPRWISTICAVFLCEIPIRIKTAIKNALRPLYRKLFGYRKIKQSSRI